MELDLGSPWANGRGKLSRRGFGGLCLAATGALSWPTFGLAAPIVPSDRVFTIYRHGAAIGRHEVRFAPAADGLIVTTDIELAVKIAFITAFHFEQSAVERWVDGRLVESRVETDDNGEASRTRIEASGDRLNVAGGVANQSTTVPLGMMTDTAFWNIDIVRQHAVIDTHMAALTEVAAEARGRQWIEIAGGVIEAEHFGVTADSGRHGEIWFDTAGNWVKGLMTTRGETLEYRLTV